MLEECKDFADARRWPETTPIARPVIYTLAGVRPGEQCVIERTEEGFCDARDFDLRRQRLGRREPPGVEGRVGADVVMTCSREEAGAASHRRREALAGWAGTFGADSFGWVTPPVLNRFTRLAIEMCAAGRTLRVAGYESARRAPPRRGAPPR